MSHLPADIHRRLEGGSLHPGYRIATVMEPRYVAIPNGATHYVGSLFDGEGPCYLKMTMVGVVGEHWWRWVPGRAVWVLAGHWPPHRMKEVPR